MAVLQEPFKYTIEINNKLKGTRTVMIVESTMLWFRLEQQLAEALNVYPASLHARFRFSTDHKDVLPCDLTSQKQLDTMIALLRPRIVPGRTKSGQPSVRPMRQVTVQVFNGNDEPVQSDAKVSYI